MGGMAQLLQVIQCKMIKCESDSYESLSKTTLLVKRQKLQEVSTCAYALKSLELPDSQRKQALLTLQKREGQLKDEVIRMERAIHGPELTTHHDGEDVKGEGPHTGTGNPLDIHGESAFRPGSR